MMRRKISDWGNMLNNQRDGEDPFGEPPIIYNYKCRKCNYNSEMNEAHVDVAYGWTKKRSTILPGIIYTT